MVGCNIVQCHVYHEDEFITNKSSELCDYSYDFFIVFLPNSKFSYFFPFERNPGQQVFLMLMLKKNSKSPLKTKKMLMFLNRFFLGAWF